MQVPRRAREPTNYPAFPIENGRNGALTEVDDIGGLVERAGELLADGEAAEAFRRQGLVVVQRYRWSAVAARLHDEVYAPFMG